MNEETIRSSRLPGGSLVAALFDREVMIVADRGGASNAIGHRWADLAAAYAAGWVADGRTIQTAEGDEYPVVRVDRLDATPRIAATASRRGLQNPDLLLIAQQGSRQALQAADAKFSVETARSKQVSPDVVQALLTIRDQVPELLPDLGSDVDIAPGIFLSPDYPLTHLMLQRRRGIVRTTVRPNEVELIPVVPDRFWGEMEGSSLIDVLAAVDSLPVLPEDSLMAGVYYFRLARAALGFWLDATKPLLLFHDVVTVDEPRVRAEAQHRAVDAISAIAMIRQWDADVQAIRDQRAAIDQAAGLPIPGRDLRPLIARAASHGAGQPPSANQVRRRLGAWYRGELRQRVGPLLPPLDDVPAVQRQLAAIARELAPQAERMLERIVVELMAERETLEPSINAVVSNVTA